MIDQFAILLSHGLMALAGLRLLFRDDFDKEPPQKPNDDTLRDNEDTGKGSAHAA